MLPAGTLNLDVVTQRTRDSPELNLIVAEAAVGGSSARGGIGSVAHCLLVSKQQAQGWYWGPAMRAVQAGPFQPALPYCDFSNSSHYLYYLSYVHFLSLLSSLFFSSKSYPIFSQ